MVSPVITSSDNISWTCPSCTYRHESRNEQEFLSCAMCLAQRPKDVKVKNDLRSKISSQRLNETKIFSEKTENDATKSRKLASTYDTIRKRPRQQQLSTFNFVKKSSRTQHDKNQIKHNSTFSAPRRSILDALKPQTSSSFVPKAKYRCGSGKWQEVEDALIPQLCPMTIVRDVLPTALATRLLQQLEEDSETWNRGNWILFGKEHKIPRTTATYRFANSMMEKIDDNSNSEKSDQIAYNFEEQEEYADRQSHRHVSPELQQAARRVVEVVEQQCPWSQNSWEPTFALANRYANGQDCVGWHADHITTLGPRPIIVGLTLGACRRFEMRQTPPSATKHGNDNHQQQGRHVSVSLPHNSLCIMWNDAQESWQHSVPKCSDDSMVQHPLVGTARISLTFRQKRVIPDQGNCYCGRPVGLRAKDGRYYLFCQPYGKDKNKTCNFWKASPWAQEEAKRLLQLERESSVKKTR